MTVYSQVAIALTCCGQYLLDRSIRVISNVLSLKNSFLGLNDPSGMNTASTAKGILW